MNKQVILPFSCEISQGKSLLNSTIGLVFLLAVLSGLRFKMSSNRKGDQWIDPGPSSATERMKISLRRWPFVSGCDSSVRRSAHAPINKYAPISAKTRRRRFIAGQILFTAVHVKRMADKFKLDWNRWGYRQGGISE